jgi:HD-like signal output (HDOD) protein/CheY-like chemotaxis protein
MNRILFVDDNPRVLAGLSDMLRPRHDVWDIRFVEGAAAALKAMEAQPVDVVVSDFQMPGVDGGQLLAEVRRRFPDAARLILSAQSAEKDLIKVVTIAHQFLPKPCEPEALIAAIERTLRLRDELGAEWLRIDLSGVETLPSPPTALQGMLKILDSPDSGVRDVAEILQQDIAVAAKVLQLVNSSFFAPRSRITSLERAVARLGIRTIRALILTEEVVRTFRTPDGVLDHWLTSVNAHGLQTAMLARRLATRDARDDAFCAGLLHECGQMVFATCRPGVFLAHLSLREREGRPLVDIERETFGVHHAQAGANLLTLWGFPADIVDAVAHHADPIDAACPARGRLSASEAVRLAHCLIESEGIRLCSAPGAPGVSEDWLEEIGALDEVQAWRAEGSRATATAS